MCRCPLYGFIVGFMLLACASASAATATPKAASPYDAFVAGATVQNGLIPFIIKDGNVYLALSTSQLGKDFIETSVPSTGLAGYGPSAGERRACTYSALRALREQNRLALAEYLHGGAIRHT